MDTYNYLAVLVSIILGLGITNHLSALLALLVYTGFLFADLGKFG